MKFDSLIQQLKDIALKSNMKIKLAAGIFYSKKGFIATGYNTTRTYSKNTITPSEHAECAVLRELKKIPFIQTKKMKLLVIRIGCHSLLQSTPCMNCTNEIFKHGIKKVYYVNEHNEIVSKSTLELRKTHHECPYSNINTTTIWFQQVQTPLYNMSIPIELISNVGNKVIQLRETLQLTQSQLAMKLSLSVKSIIEIEEGKLFNMLLFSKLVRHFGKFILE